MTDFERIALRDATYVELPDNYVCATCKHFDLGLFHSDISRCNLEKLKALSVQPNGYCDAWEDRERRDGK